MRGLMLITALAVSNGVACFPDPPARDGSADLGGETAEPDDTSGGDAANDATSTAEAVDSVATDTGVEAADAPDSDAPDSDAPDSDAPDSDAPDSDAPDSDAPDSDAAADVAADADEPDVRDDGEVHSDSEVVAPECDRDEDCDRLDAPCVAGSCADGACVTRPLTGADCDDGLACTTDDTCVDGACLGQGVICSPLDQCHDAGECDAGTGLCSNPAKPDTSACDDGLKCTADDQCTTGVCGGSAVVCERLDQCHEAGVCDAATGLCSNPSESNGTTCDDADFCTEADECTNGFCFGADSPPLADYVLGFESDGKLSINGVASRPSGEAIVAFTFLGSNLDLVGSSTSNIIAATAGEVYCRSYLGRIRPDGSLAAATVFAEPAGCLSYVGIGRLHLPGDDTSIVLGSFSEAFTTASGVSIGQSPTGLILDDGLFLARVTDDGDVLWDIEFLGFGDSFDAFGLPSMSFNASNEGAISVNVGRTSDPRQVVDRNGAVVLQETFPSDAASLVYVVGPSGDIRRSLRIEAPEGTFVRATQYTDDGTIILVGATIGGDTTIKTVGATLEIPSAVHTQPSSWVVAIDATGRPMWWRHVFVPPFAQATNDDLTALPFGAALRGDRLWIAFDSQRHLSSRADQGAGALVTTSSGAHTGRLTVLELSKTTGAVVAAAPLGVMATYAPSLLADELGLVFAGQTLGLELAGDSITSADSPRPYLGRLGQWGIKVAFEDQLTDSGAFLPLRAEAFYPRTSLDNSGGFYVAGNLNSAALVGDATVVGVTPRGTGTAGYLARLGAKHRLDCR